MILVNKISRKILGDNDRTIRAGKNILYSFLIKGYSVVIQFALVPLTLHYLDKFHYGIWLTLASLLEWFNFFDIGIGHGLRNKLAEALAQNNTALCKTYISTAYAFVATIFTGFIIIFCLINPFLHWASILNTSASLGSELRSLVLYVFIFFCLRFIFNLISVVIYANQSPALNNLMGPLGSTLSFIAIYILTKTTTGSLFWAAMVLSAAPLIILILFNLLLFNTKYKHIKPAIKHVDFKYAKDLLGLGLQFFVIQMSILVVFSTDNIILTQLFGPAQVTVYNIAFKYFTIALLINSIITYTFWTPFTEAYVKRDFDWIRKTLAKLDTIALVLIIGVFLSTLVADKLVYLWVGNAVVIPLSMKIALALYVIINLSSAPYNMFINGSGKIRLQLYMAILSIITTIPLSYLFSKTLGFGPSGVTIAMVFTVLPNAILWRIQSNKILNGTAANVWNK
ncbi:lipopolysaccharide biosynthesis protein [Mucilaginibacter lacusdianchii]|uniref:lipopolysaccharide biosynthesis protein n=1 Tax=Mucilaginibacter lacusdianchii TaxID=2684211 RepID=UPI00131C5048|nr:polysaccharide biosynthesis protein [Mucilaginibacter sp. JXJ CY 39]